GNRHATRARRRGLGVPAAGPRGRPRRGRRCGAAQGHHARVAVRTWTGGEDALSMEEHWTEPAGGILLGLHRDVKEGRTVLFEFLRIEETPDAVTYWASPKGRPA